MDMQDSDEFVVGVRNDYNLHCYKLTAGSADVVWQMQYILSTKFTVYVLNV